jgi:hypothetical protein
LKQALELLLGRPCYHMREVFCDGDSWWESASQTVFRTTGLNSPAWDAMNEAIQSSRFPMSRDTEQSAIRGFDLRNDRVRATVEPSRLVEWHLGDGWDPICEALGRQVPDEPFPHTNTREQWLAREQGSASSGPISRSSSRRAER